MFVNILYVNIFHCLRYLLPRHSQRTLVVLLLQTPKLVHFKTQNSNPNTSVIKLVLRPFSGAPHAQKPWERSYSVTSNMQQITQLCQPVAS